MIGLFYLLDLDCGFSSCLSYKIWLWFELFTKTGMDDLIKRLILLVPICAVNWCKILQIWWHKPNMYLCVICPAFLIQNWYLNPKYYILQSFMLSLANERKYFKYTPTFHSYLILISKNWHGGLKWNAFQPAFTVVLNHTFFQHPWDLRKTCDQLTTPYSLMKFGSFNH